jgi:hypothetical protein
MLIALIDGAIARHMDPGSLERMKRVEEAEKEAVRDVLAALAGVDEDGPEDDDD